MVREKRIHGAQLAARHGESHRPDVQALRGVAVLAVVAYHAGLPFVQAGYLGVDVFFVISGYLITSSIIRAEAFGGFSLPNFYIRRALRLLPAAYVTVFAVCMLCPIFLTSTRWPDFIWQGVGAITYTSNIVLWNQAGYFDADSMLKPFLHFWSLAIEEQFYLLFPLLFIVARGKRMRLALIATGVLASLTLLFIEGFDRPVASFYLLPFRAWELLFGAALAFSGGRDNQRWHRALSSATFVILVALITISSEVSIGPHPGVQAVIVCLATGVILRFGAPILAGGLARKSLVPLGDISYSLYLVHWPLFAYARNAYLGEVPFVVSLALALASVLLAYLMWRHIENPVRHNAAMLRSPGLTVAGVVVGSALAISPMIFLDTSHASDYALRTIDNSGRENCSFYRESFSLERACKSTSEPAVLVWGDSYARHLTWGLADAGIGGVIDGTMNNCGPALGLATVDNSAQWGRDCFAFQESVIKFIETDDNLELVILSSVFTHYVGEGRVRSGNEVVQKSAELAVERLSLVIERIENAGKSVVLISKPPLAGYDVGECARRLKEGRLLLREWDCSVLVDTSHGFEPGVAKLLEQISVETGVQVLTLADLLCRPDCVSITEGMPVYADGGHLSYNGSMLLARRGIGERINEMVRDEMSRY